MYLDLFLKLGATSLQRIYDVQIMIMMVIEIAIVASQSKPHPSKENYQNHTQYILIASISHSPKENSFRVKVLPVKKVAWRRL